MMDSEPKRVLYCEYVAGLESGPHGFKVEELRQQGLEVIAPSMEMSVWNITKCNSVARRLVDTPLRLIKPPWKWVGSAVDDAFEGCVSVLREAVFKQPEDSPIDCVVGASWGGAVAAALLAEGCWKGPTILMSPTLRQKDRWCEDGYRSSAQVTLTLAALPPEIKAQCLILHGTADRTVPLEDSKLLSEATGIQLEVIEGGTHGLSSIVHNGQLSQYVRRITEAPAPPPQRLDVPRRM